MAYPLDQQAHGITAVVLPGPDLERAVLDLAAVLEGLVADRFEVLLVVQEHEVEGLANDLRARAPGLPLRTVQGANIADGCDAASYELIFVSVQDGKFDVRELNHLLAAIETGADVAAGYRPRRTDALVRTFQRLGWRVDVDCAFALLRRSVWQQVQSAARGDWCCAMLVRNARGSGHRVSEVPVRHRRPTIGAPAAA